MQSENSYLLLIDSSTNTKEFKTLKKSFKKIITFDIESDREFTLNQIDHIVSDELIEKNELQLIDSKCIDYCQWYSQNNGNELLSYENVNLGSLFRIEFHNFLIPLIKNFLILNKLKSLYPNSKFYCSPNLSQIAQNLGMNPVPINEKSPNIELTWDKVQYNFTSSISLKFSKKNYKKIKNYSNIINNFLLKKKHEQNNNNNFGLIEFDPIKYRKIFQESNNSDISLHLYNRHRPLFHNLESLKILKNSSIIPYAPSNESIKKNQTKINNEHKKLLKNFYQFLNDDEFFNSFFTFQKIPFWNYVKLNLIKIFENKILDSLHEIEYAKNFLLSNNLNYVIILSEAGFTEQIFLSLAKKFSVNVILLQHGVILDNSSALNYNKIVAGVLPIDSDYFFSWGKISSNYISNLNFIKSQIHIIGNMNIDRIFETKDQHSNNSNYVLLLATGPRNQQSIGHDVNAWKKYESTIKLIYDSVSKHNLNLIIKRHPDSAETDFSETLYSDLSNVKILKNGDLSDLLLNTKIVLSIGVSSGTLEAQILHKPVISILSEHDVFGNAQYIPDSCIETSIEEFDETFSRIITNDADFEQLCQKGNEFIVNNISNIGNASSIFLDTLKKL